MLYSGLDEVFGVFNEKKSEEDFMFFFIEIVYYYL